MNSTDAIDNTATQSNSSETEQSSSPADTSWISTVTNQIVVYFISIYNRVCLSLVRLKCLIYGIPDIEEDDDEDDKHLVDSVNEAQDDDDDDDDNTSKMKDLLRSYLFSSLKQNPKPQTNGCQDVLEEQQQLQNGDITTNDQLVVLVYNLELNAFNKSKHFQCEKYTRVRFNLGPSLYGHSVKLFTDYLDDYTQFKSKIYHEVNIKDALQLCSSGSFHFFYTELDKPKEVLGSFYIVVNPQLTIFGGKDRNAEILPVNAIQCQTVLAKCMGPIDSWKDKLKVSIECGYNMIHWTPIQELGDSRSAYSLANQHRLNPAFRTQTMIDRKRDCTLADIAAVVNELRTECGVLSITDIVLNHTANESPWLKEHPEAAYNCSNAPWLRPAFLLDRLFWHLSLDIEDGKWAEQGLTVEVNTKQHLNKVRSIFINEYLPLVKLEEFYLCDESKVIEAFEDYLIKYIYGKNAKKGNLNKAPIVQHPLKASNQYDMVLELVQDAEYRRFGSSVDFEKTLHFLLHEVKYVGQLEDREAINRWITFALLYLEKLLKELNQSKEKVIKEHLTAAVTNVIRGALYERLDRSGPKIAKVSKQSPLATQYFSDEINGHHNKDLIQIEESLYDPTKSCFYMAHNGWIMGDNPLRNFAEQDSWVYLRRELVCWGDSTKLRYGKVPEDSPFLWSFMEKYVQQMASTFQGLRLDNCHSTPIHVAKYLLDAARRVNPNLYLIAELFTGSEDIDNLFVNKLGIISLVREAMSAPTSDELGRQVYHYSGEAVGSFDADIPKTPTDCHSDSRYVMRPFVSTIAHAIFFDQTHDNESPIVRRTAFDPLASSALVSMTYSATGSTRGLDELVPHHINVVYEERQYNVWREDVGTDGVNQQMGIIKGKQLLNQLHDYLATNGYSQVYVDQRDRDTVVVTRHNPNTHESVILAARTAFLPLYDGYASHLEPLRIEGKFETILFEMKMTGQPDDADEDDGVFERDGKIINGYRQISNQVQTMLDLDMSQMIDLSYINKTTNLVNFKAFPPSSVIAFSVSLLNNQKQLLKAIRRAIEQYEDVESEIRIIVKQLNAIDLNYVLFRSNQEEIDETEHGVYTVGSAPFLYCGLAGVMFHLDKIRKNNDLGNPLCDNLRDGNWLPEYIVARLKRRPETVKLAQWLEVVFTHLSGLPRYLIPRYFDSILLPLYSHLLGQIWTLSSAFIRNGDNFVQRLALGGIALIGSHSPSPLPPLAPMSIPPSLSYLAGPKLPTMAAGLPHFSSGYMRNWGRDTFIALKGLTLLTGHFDVAKVIILGFGGTLRHGLIPNLLEGGRNSRYNCRDAVWWWLQSIKDYIQIVPDGHNILNEQVRRIFPTDDSPALLDASDKVVLEPLHATIQQALDRHFSGIDFVERNAGTQIDEHMKEEGFKIQIGVDRKTGFVYGGNQWNCGTWMDKMGSSAKAGNKGHPASPRDGSAVEIVALSKSVISFLAELHHKKQYPHKVVEKCDEFGGVLESWTFKQWATKIQNNFELHFYVDEQTQDNLVNRRQIYKDTFGATKKWMDFQLRPNFLIAMCVANELFDGKHAVKALEMVDKHLLGPFGMKTLDPSDGNYRGDYDNSNDSTDYTVAHGFNYHNGPEWLWPTGFYFMARLKFIPNQKNEISRINQHLAAHYESLVASEWFGLHELTNTNGSPCYYSCPIQAWTHATLLELLHLKNDIERKMSE